MSCQGSHQAVVTGTMKAWTCAVFLALLGIAAAQTCPSPWFDAHFVALADEPLTTASREEDFNLTYFRNVLRFTEQEIERQTQNAIQFFNTTYGLDFSQSQPDAQGQRFYQNATFFPSRNPFSLRVSSNRWILNGNTRSRCFNLQDGGYWVYFTAGPQMLRGTYGGEQGRLITFPDNLRWGFYSIDACAQQPIVMQYQSRTPYRRSVDGITYFNHQVSSRVLGTGSARGLQGFVIDPSTGFPTRVSMQLVFIFPDGL